MANVVIMPRQGQSVESCIITAWQKKKGDHVNEKDILFINIYHPSSGQFYTDAEWDNMYPYFKDIFNLD